MSVSNFFGCEKSKFKAKNTTDTSRSNEGLGESELNLDGRVEHPDTSGGVEALKPVISGYLKAKRQGQALSIEERKKLRAQVLTAMLSDSSAGGLDGDPRVLWDAVNMIFDLSDPYVPGTVELFARSGDLHKADGLSEKIRKDIEEIRGIVEGRNGTAATSVRKEFFVAQGHADRNIATPAQVALGKALANGSHVASQQHHLEERTGRFKTATQVDSRVLVDGTAAPATLSKATEADLRKSLEKPLIIG
jgi:hypothetical protein